MHRDIKPQNLLIDPTCHILKICDFGSAKKYKEDDSSIAYITSRYYRAPELIFGNTKYDQKIDIWSAGCVIAEIIQGTPIFHGADAHTQIIEIIKKLGTPSEEDVTAMNPDYQNKQLPKVVGLGWERILGPGADPQAMDLVSKMIKYDPTKRISLYRAMAHPFFEELRLEDLTLPNGNCIPDLFSFSEKEKDSMGGEGRDNLIPEWYDPYTSPGVHVIDAEYQTAIEAAQNQNEMYKAK